jgi:hypothetical protein
MPNHSPLWITVPPSQWRACDATAPITLFTELAEDHEVARDWRGTAFVTFDDVDEGYAFLSLRIQGFLRHLFASVPHALYFLDPNPDYCGMLYWLASRPEVEFTAAADGFVLTVIESLRAAADAMFFSVATFAVEMGDDWLEATRGHIKTLQELVPSPEALGSQRVGDNLLSRLTDTIGQRYGGPRPSRS